MALMPMPPMPRMWKVPRSPGICIVVLFSPATVPMAGNRTHRLAAKSGSGGRTRPCLHDRRPSAPRPDRQGAPRHPAGPGSGGRRRMGQLLRRTQQLGQHVGKARRRQILLLDAPRRTRLGEARCILQLVVVKGVRQRHQDRRAADDRQAPPRSTRPARPMTSWADAMSSGRSSKNAASSAATPAWRRRCAHALQILLAALLDDAQPRT